MSSLKCEAILNQFNYDCARKENVHNIYFYLNDDNSGQLVQERAASREKNQPLCMAQYHRLLGSCRRPGDPRDSQYLPEPKTDQHVIVTCRNQVLMFFS